MDCYRATQITHLIHRLTTQRHTGVMIKGGIRVISYYHHNILDVTSLYVELCTGDTHVSVSKVL